MAERDMKKTTKEFLKFGDIKIEKKKFHCFKEIIDISDVDIGNSESHLMAKTKKRMQNTS